MGRRRRQTLHGGPLRRRSGNTDTAPEAGHGAAGTVVTRGGAGTLAGDISAPGRSPSPISVRVLLKARRGAGGRVTAERGPAWCRGQAIRARTVPAASTRN